MRFGDRIALTSGTGSKCVGTPKLHLYFNPPCTACVKYVLNKIRHHELLVSIRPVVHFVISARVQRRAILWQGSPEHACQETGPKRVKLVLDLRGLEQHTVSVITLVSFNEFNQLTLEVANNLTRSFPFLVVTLLLRLVLCQGLGSLLGL